MNYINNNIKKIVLIFFYSILSVVTIVYFLAGGILFYIGPLETIKVKRNLKNNPVDIVVSLTTTPDKINQIQLVLKSIYRQSIKPDRIYLNIPREFNNNSEKDITPNWLKTDSKIIINKTNNYGSATKLITTLEKERDPNTIIITVNDDHIYPKHMVRDLAKQYLPDTYKVNYKLGAAITGVGLNILVDPNFKVEPKSILIGDRPSTFIVSMAGVAYKRAFFKDNIFSLINNIPKSCVESDDLMISAYLLSNGGSIVKISGISYNEIMKSLLIKELPGATTKDNLYRNYGQCLAELPLYNKAKYQLAILKRSRTIYLMYNNEILYNYIIKLYYDYLTKIIQYVPFIKKMIIMVMN